MTPATILDDAKIELLEAIDYYESRCSGLGLDFEKEIKSSIKMIREFPERWHLRHDGTQRYLIHRFPYFVVYLYYGDHIWIIAFAHCKRKPEYWVDRLEISKT